MKYGYARVSTKEQETTLQLDALQRVGVPNEHITQEKRSGAGQRPKLMELLNKLGKGDTVVVYKFDRLSRSMLDLLKIIHKIESRGATFQSITEAVDTSSPAGRMMLTMLGAFAEFERGMIRERSMAGQRAAMERGVHCGRRRGMKPDDESALVNEYATGIYTMHELATKYDVHPSTVKRAIYRVTKPHSSSLL